MAVQSGTVFLSENRNIAHSSIQNADVFISKIHIFRTLTFSRAEVFKRSANEDEYEEEAEALIQGNTVTLLFSAERGNGRRAVHAVSCSQDLAREFNRTLPLEKPDEIKLFRKHGMLTKVRIRCGEAYLVVEDDDDEGLQ